MAGLDAFGTQFTRSDMAATTPVFTPLANCTGITPPAIKRDTIEVTSHTSPEGWKEYLGGLKDGGEVKLDVNYDPRVHDDLVAEDLASGDPRDYKVVFPGTLGEWAFTAVLTGFEPDAPVDDALTASLTYQVSGKPTLSTVSEG